MTTPITETLRDFTRDTVKGLSSQPKYLLSKYFYDEEGDRLFQQIMKMPEYYLTNAEYEILSRIPGQLPDLLGQEPFDLIELGAGDGFKTRILLEYLLQNKAAFRYLPVDISSFVLGQLKDSLAQEFPSLEVIPMQGDYFRVLAKLDRKSENRKLILFLGSNIGNFRKDRVGQFLNQVRTAINVGDRALIGFDLKKDPAIIRMAYADPHGITTAFNLNHLHRINRELGGNFKPSAFRHWANYDPLTGQMRSFLISLIDQEVTLTLPGKTFLFRKWEPIDMELSQKYDLLEINDMAQRNGFKVLEHFTDSREYFSDSLWEAV